MRNIKANIKGSILHLEIDLSKEQGDSKTGKSLVIGSTDGNVDVAGGYKMGINVYKPKTVGA